MLEIQEKFSSDGYENVIAEAGSKNLHITEAMDKNNVIGFIAYAYNDDAVMTAEIFIFVTVLYALYFLKAVLKVLTVQFLKLRIKLNLPD